MKVMIAEDEIVERKAMRKFLEENIQSLEVVGEAMNGRKAIELAKTLSPDIILMDIKMPGINGLEAMEEICNIHPMTKFIMVTAYDSFDYAKQAMKLGVKEYILKPSKKEETIRAIFRVMKEIDQDKQMSDIRSTLLLKMLIQGENTYNLQRKLCPNMQSGFFIVMNKYVALPSEFIQYEKIGLYVSDEKIDNAFVLKMVRKLQLQLGEDIFIGVGHPYSLPNNLASSYYEAKQALRHLVEVGQKKYGFPTRIESSPDFTPLMQALKEGDEDRVWSYFDVAVKQLDIEAYFKVKQLLEERDLSFPEIPYEQLTSSEEWREFFQIVCLEIRRYFQSKNKVERAKKFIHENYHKSFSLEDVSKYTDLSTNYLSNLFHEETGETFSDYLTEIRIQKAKELLQQNEATLKEISFLVGYRDPNYFSRVFKKNVGRSPKQYQMMILK
ncbi:response regulator [Gracilibacillus saliphilus]|uniref:response regulator n=1 Tax=Gracilibacillus saliphilus TaxID=543890 RepID=UPI0013D67CEC|nr:response regulator [Gracilibacillus saliphilus]